MDQVKFLTCALAACAVLAASAPALAGSAAKEVQLKPSDVAAVASATHRFMSATVKRSLTPAFGKLRSDVGGQESSGGGSGSGSARTRYPGDVTFQGGQTVAAAVQHTLYLIPNGSACAAPACWGNADQFLHDINRSDFIHVTDQYTGTSADHRYPYAGSPLLVHYDLPTNPLVDADMAAYAHAAAVSLGGASGYGHVYHIFLAPEQNECFDTSYTICSSNVFCAYHGSAVFTDIGEVVYTVEPYQVNVFGCNVRTGTPNGAFDDTYDVLSHELFETISDPDGNAWWNTVAAGMQGQEIGDECVFLLFDAAGFYSSSDPAIVSAGGHLYALQPEYSNSAHGCATHPSD